MNNMLSCCIDQTMFSKKMFEENDYCNYGQYCIIDLDETIYNVHQNLVNDKPMNNTNNLIECNNHSIITNILYYTIIGLNVFYQTCIPPFK